MSKVFLSHNHADKPFTRRLAGDLRKAGHTVWIDEAEINIGDSLIDKIRAGLDDVDYVAAVLSEKSIDSPWVQRELEIASNREIEERRVVVLPLMVQLVALPGFLKGKFYADFTDPDAYPEMFQLLLRTLGPASPLPKPPAEEIDAMRQELSAMKEALAEMTKQNKAHERMSLRHKSPSLVAAVEKANERYPSHAPINNTYAFEVGSTPVTLDYLLWGISKAMRTGAHVLESLLSMYNRWEDAERMIQAYDDLLASYD
ncbi:MULTISPECIES: toll/interleukin-1 receptor domain-containing protein [Pseudomonas]|jgi:hypothetical protein|uniref:toll/interleukin-1 receptor domain-containing protein n=1 Tax=Pseudomonas TaxID=286 RepID=UPI0001FB9E74|nr:MULTISPECIES: toll/interleukin-1 receptor domain-containing protein [Pseudomonas]EGB97439.1 molecular chaperone Tir [Pseudomonas sp. TJI-51]MBI6914969.1 toll/interleukin-1 receptor domain-containing protein [Pseudomonas juntendi]MDG9917151.1 toll/interleukin-1 receptor domain-containing protein [Pseudomonas juntendi]MDH0045206.1 toll/interleukin-1 receptor domain-containing protein [Pseudomonas juntendi]MDH0505773.1 toll/interleukin-1 receptor domain-containing protein [Pseudomonas juntendi